MMDNIELKKFLLKNMELLKNQDYQALYEQLPENDRSYFTTFVYTKGRKDPLKYMKTIVPGMFRRVQMDNLVIPANIESGTIVGLTAKKVIVKNPLNGKLRINFKSCSIDKLILEDGIRSIPDNFCEGANFIKLPKSVLRIGKNSFIDADIIATYRRDDRAEKLVIPTTEIDFYKKRLRWIRENSEE